MVLRPIFSVCCNELQGGCTTQHSNYIITPRACAARSNAVKQSRQFGLYQTDTFFTLFLDCFVPRNDGEAKHNELRFRGFSHFATSCRCKQRGGMTAKRKGNLPRGNN